MGARKAIRRHGERERGQSLVELMLSLTLLLTVLVGVLDLGRAYMTYLALQNAAGEGALYGAIHPTWVTSCTTGQFGCSTIYDNIVARVRGEAPGGQAVNWNAANIAVTTDGSTRPGHPITVTISYQYQLFTPILSRIWPTFNLQGTAVEMIMGNPETP